MMISKECDTASPISGFEEPEIQNTRSDGSTEGTLMCLRDTPDVHWEHLFDMEKTEYFFFKPVKSGFAGTILHLNVHLFGQHCFARFIKVCNIYCSRVRTIMLSRKTLILQHHLIGRLLDMFYCFLKIQLRQCLVLYFSPTSCVWFF